MNFICIYTNIVRLLEKQASAAMRLIFFSILLFFNSLSLTQAEDISIPKMVQIATEEYAPFTSAKLKQSGIFSHIVSEAFRLEGVEVEYTFFPAARSYNLAKVGKIDGTMPWAHRDEREVDFLYSDPVMDVGGEHLFYRKGFEFTWNAKIQDYRTLKNINIGAINSYNYGKKFQDAEAKGIIKVYRVTTLKQLYLMLLKGHIDIVISKEWVGRYVLQSEFTPRQIAQIESSPETADPPSYDYLLISKLRPNFKNLLEVFNAGLKKLHKSGRYDAILKAFRNGEYVKP